jgi:AraC-like DNA-binding protein
VLAVKNVPKYEKSTLTPARASAYVSKLLHLMESERLFARSELKLQDLAHQLDISPHHLSQIINERLGQNFFEFINHYQQFTILSLALEVGFNNKASFNAAFKKHTGMTPSQFRDTHVKTDKI